MDREVWHAAIHGVTELDLPAGLSLVAESGGYSLVAVCGLLIVVLWLQNIQQLSHMGSLVVAHGLSCSETYEILVL